MATAPLKGEALKILREELRDSLQLVDSLERDLRPVTATWITTRISHLRQSLERMDEVLHPKRPERLVKMPDTVRAKSTRYLREIEKTSRSEKVQRCVGALYALLHLRETEDDTTS